MTKEEWIKKCADEFVKVSGTSIELAFDCAEECAKYEEEDSKSENPEKWESPEDAAYSEMSYWEAD